MKGKNKKTLLTAMIIFLACFTCLSYLLSGRLITCYRVQLVNGREEIFSPEIYIDGAVWVEDNCLIYRPFRAAFYIRLKDSVLKYERIKCKAKN